MFSRIISSAQLSQRLVKLLAEVLERHGRGDEARVVVRQALSEVCATFDPNDAIQLELFANGELAEAVADVVGPEYVDEVVDFVTATAQPGERPHPAAFQRLSARGGDPPPPAAPSVAEPALETEPASQKLALVITDDDGVFDRASRVLDRAGILCFDCGPDPLEVVSEARALEATFVVYDCACSPEHPATLSAQVRRALRDACPRTLVLLDDRARPASVDRQGWLASVAKGEIERELVPRLLALEKEPRDRHTQSMPQTTRRRRTGAPRTGGAAATTRRGRRTFDHVLGEALGSVANDRILQVVLETALESADLKSVPSSTEKFARFVDGPLRTAVNDLLGDTAYQAVTQALKPVIQQAITVNYQRRGAPTAIPQQSVPRSKVDRLLLVHGDPKQLKRLASMLEKHCHDLLTASDGYVALGMMLQQHPPDVVVADARTPSVSGEDLIAQAKRMHGDEAPPVVILGRGQRDRVSGAFRVLDSPVSPRELVDAITSV